MGRGEDRRLIYVQATVASSVSLPVRHFHSPRRRVVGTYTAVPRWRTIHGDPSLRSWSTDNSSDIHLAFGVASGVA